MIKLFTVALRRMQYYAVARGRTTGIFHTWPECQTQVNGFTGAVFKKFKTQTEAETFIQQNSLDATLGTRANYASNSSQITNNGLNAQHTTKRRGGLSNLTTAVPAKKSKINEQKTSEYTADIVRMVRHGRYDFMEDENGYTHVYTDGSCENNGGTNAAAGYGVYFGEGHALNTSAPVVGPPTNNRGEIQAATKAISLAAESGVPKLCINSDSHFVIKSVTQWLAGWKAKGWRLSNGQAVKNESDFRELDRVIQSSRSKMSILWKYVPAHSGIRGNERADELAKKGAAAYR